MQARGLADVTVSNLRKLARGMGKMNSCFQNFRSGRVLTLSGQFPVQWLWQVSQLRGSLGAWSR